MSALNENNLSSFCNACGIDDDKFRKTFKEFKKVVEQIYKTNDRVERVNTMEEFLFHVDVTPSIAAACLAKFLEDTREFHSELLTCFGILTVQRDTEELK